MESKLSLGTILCYRSWQRQGGQLKQRASTEVLLVIFSLPVNSPHGFHHPPSFRLAHWFSLTRNKRVKTKRNYDFSCHNTCLPWVPEQPSAKGKTPVIQLLPLVTMMHCGCNMSGERLLAHPSPSTGTYETTVTHIQRHKVTPHLSILCWELILFSHLNVAFRHRLTTSLPNR